MEEQNFQPESQAEYEKIDELNIRTAPKVKAQWLILGSLLTAVLFGLLLGGYYFLVKKRPPVVLPRKEVAGFPTISSEIPSTEIPTISPASARENLVLFAYKQFSPSVTKTFVSDANGQNKVEIDIGYGDEASVPPGKAFRFSGTKSGLYLARWNNDKLEVASSDRLISFSKIVEVSAPNERLSNILWSNNGSKIAYIITKDLEPNQPFGATEKRLYLINRDGSGQNLIKQFSEPHYVVLQGLNLSRNELYWFETGPGGFVSNFTSLNLTDGTVKETKKELNPELGPLIFSFDFSKAYYVNKVGNKIIEYALADNNKRVLYELKEIGQDKYGNKSFIDRLMLSPNGNLLVFTQVNEPSDKEIAYSVALPGGQINVLLDDPSYYNVGPFYWSPDGKYLWFETFCHGCGKESGFDNEGEYYIMDMDTKKLSLFFKGKKGKYEETGEGVRINETLRFLGWLVQ